MSSFLAGTDTEIESVLVDLSSVSLTNLRKLDNAALRRSLRLVVEQTAHVRITASSGDDKAKRID